MFRRSNRGWRRDGECAGGRQPPLWDKLITLRERMVIRGEAGGQKEASGFESWLIQGARRACHSPWWMAEQRHHANAMLMAAGATTSSLSQSNWMQIAAFICSMKTCQIWIILTPKMVSYIDHRGSLCPVSMAPLKKKQKCFVWNDLQNKKVPLCLPLTLLEHHGTPE